MNSQRGLRKVTGEIKKEPIERVASPTLSEKKNSKNKDIVTEDKSSDGLSKMKTKN